MLFDFYVKTWFEGSMGEKVLIAVLFVLGQLAALAVLILVRGWFDLPRERRVPLTPPEPELPESGVVIHHKKVCTCQHGCKSGECDK
jgi:hypothetical protein